MSKAWIKPVLHWVGVLLTTYAVWLYWSGWYALTLPRIGTALFYTLLLVMFLIRKPSQQENTSGQHAIFAIAGTFLPFAMMGATIQLPDWVIKLSYGIEVVGIVGSLIAVSFLGRGFGIFAANRAITTRGLYKLVRHPLYAGEALWFLSIVLQNFSPFNLLLWTVQVSCQIVRLIAEEKLLSQDPTYVAYTQQVRYRLLPGVF